MKTKSKNNQLVMYRWQRKRKTVVRRVLPATAALLDLVPDRCRPFVIHWCLTSGLSLSKLDCQNCSTDFSFNPDVGLCTNSVLTKSK